VTAAGRIVVLAVAGLASVTPGSGALVAHAQPPAPIEPAPTIYSIGPTHGAAGETVTIVGRGFSTDGNAVRFGPTSISGVPVAWQAAITCPQGAATCRSGINQALVVTVPRDAVGGPQAISVQNRNGVSNIATFTVTR